MSFAKKFNTAKAQFTFEPNENTPFIKPSELAHDIRQAGLKLKDMTGLHYNPLTKRYWLAPNVDVNYMVHTVKEA